MHGQVWAGTTRGLAVFDGAAWRTFANGFPACEVAALDGDPATREMWAGTWGEGLFRVSAGRADRFDQMNSGLAGNLVFAVLVDGQHVWAATNAGVSRYDTVKDTWDLYHARRADTAGVAITSLARNVGDIYGGAWRDYAQRYDAVADRWLPMALLTSLTGLGLPASHVPSAATGAVAVSGSHLWWPAGRSLLSHNSDEGWRAYEVPDAGGATPFVHAIGAADDGEIWLATDQGALVLADRDNNTWVVHRRSDDGRGAVSIIRAGRTLGTRAHLYSIPHNRVRCLTLDGDAVWLGTDGGLAVANRNVRWNELPEADSLDRRQPRVTDSTEAADEATRPDAATKPRGASSSAIAVFGPRSRTMALPGEVRQRRERTPRVDLLAVQLALERVNAERGHGGLTPIEPVIAPIGYARYGWVTPEDDLALLASHGHVSAIVGFVGLEDRVTEAAVARTEVPFVNIGEDSVASNSEADVPRPWLFRCDGDEPGQHRLFLDYLLDTAGHSRLAAIRTPGRLTGRHIDWWSSRARERGRPLVADVTCGIEENDISAALKSIQDVNAEVVLTWCDMAASTQILRRMRTAGMKQLFVGSSAMASDEFVSLVGPQPDDVIAVCPTRRQGENEPVAQFVRKYAEQNVVGNAPTPPDGDARRSFDAVDHLCSAIQAAGADRAGVKRTLEEMSRSHSGESHYESFHGMGRPMIARLRDGRWHFETLPPCRAR